MCLRKVPRALYVCCMTLDVGTVVPEFTMADRLRKAREVAGLDQAQLASELGISRASVGNYEAGNTTPRRPTLLAYAMRTGVSLAWLTTGDTAGGGPGGEGLPPLDSNQQPAGFRNALVRGGRVRQLQQPGERRSTRQRVPFERRQPAAAALDVAA